MRKGKLGYFVALSLALHGALVAVWWRSAPAWNLQLAVPELVVSLGASSPRANDTMPAPIQAASNTPAAEPDDIEPNQVPAAPTTNSNDRARENHLLSKLHYALDRHFLYPPLARRYGWEGRVLVKLRLEADGKLNPLNVVASSGYALLDRDAMSTLTRIGVVPDLREQLQGRAFETDFSIIYRLTGG